MNFARKDVCSLVKNGVKMGPPCPTRRPDRHEPFQFSEFMVPSARITQFTHESSTLAIFGYTETLPLPCKFIGQPLGSNIVMSENGKKRDAQKLEREEEKNFAIFFS